MHFRLAIASTLSLAASISRPINRITVPQVLNKRIMSSFISTPIPAHGTTGPLGNLILVSKLACDILKPMISMFYSAMNGEISSLKADASVFTIVDGLVQHLLVEHLFSGGKFSAIVGEEECAVNIKSKPFMVDDLIVPDEFSETVQSVVDEIRRLSSQIEACDEYKDITIFIDPIDGTREFSTGLGEQSSVCIGFSDKRGMPIAGLVYRPIPTPATWAAGAISEGLALHNLDVGSSSPASRPGLLTSNGGISKFISSLLEVGGLERVPSGGAGNKMLMLLEGKGAAYIQDRGVSRWDTAGAQAVIEAHGGILCKLTKLCQDSPSCQVESYSYLASPTNLDFESGVACLTPYNAADKSLVKRGEEPKAAVDVQTVKPYANLCGLVALAAPSSTETLASRPELLSSWRDKLQAAARENAPSYD